jgi:chromosome segregation ATPase
MTVELEEFTEWRHRVEARLGRLEGVGDEHVGKINHHEGLLGSIDEDLSKIQVEFRAQRSMLQALHITQNEHSAALRKLEIGQEELRTGQARVLGGVQAILGLLHATDGSGG